MKEFRSGKLATTAGVNIETLRFYEKKGVMPKPDRTPAGYRIYDINDLKRLKFIKKSQILGFTLSEIKDLLYLRVDSERSCSEVRKIASEKISSIDIKIDELQKIRDALSKLVELCKGEGPESDCPILDELEKNNN
jgi:MerR family mercuric resistance operon transcriptional regulator